MEMWTLIFLLGSISFHWTTAIELIRGNYLLKISEGTLENMTPITIDSEPDQNLNLSYLGLKRIGKNTFNDLAHVTNLNLANNELEELPPRIFSKLKNLEILSLDNNKIRILDHSFIGLNYLTTLNLSNNLVSSLTKVNLLGLTEFTDIIVEGNPLHWLKVDPQDRSQNDMNSDPWRNFHAYNMQSVDMSYQDSMQEPLSWVNSNSFYVKLCKTADGLVESTSKVTIDISPDDCLSIPLREKSFSLNLINRGLRNFQSGWFKIPTDKFRGIHFGSNDITVITPELLNDLPASITMVNFNHNKIEMIQNIENRHLRKLYLDFTLISTIEDGVLEKTNLLSISAKYNLLINLDFAKTLPMSIQELVLSHNKISMISANSLVNLRALKHLIMSSNLVTDLPMGMFRGLKDLRVIDLSNNLLEIIEPRTFKDQKQLSVLYLSGNHIKELNAGIFQGLNMVKTIDLDRNEIQKITANSFFGLKDSLIHSISLLENQIKTIERGSFARMTIQDLDLSHNNISQKSITRGAFQSCTLSTIDFSSNLFTSINGNSFYGIQVYGAIIFHHNDIEVIKNGAAMYMGSVARLDLDGTGVKYLENGAFYGFRKGQSADIIVDSGIKIIQGGVFDHFRSEHNAY